MNSLTEFLNQMKEKKAKKKKQNSIKPGIN